MSIPRLTFIVPVRNDAERLDRCLRSITDSPSDVEIQIVVADNGSTDASAAVARGRAATVVSLPDRAVAAVRNGAVATAEGELLAFVDADHELAPGWVQAAVAVFDGPAIWAAGASYHAPANGTWVQRMYDCLRDHRPGRRPTDWLPSGNLVVRRSAFAAVRGFDETLESCEDVDFCRRIREAGGVLIETDRLHSIHHGDPATLRALFLSELWRGRDNLRVSLRERLTWRSLPSVLSPVLQLLAAVAVVAGLIVAARGGAASLAVGGAVLSGLLVSARAARLLSRIRPSHARLAQFPLAWTIAAVYEAARALALVMRAGHDVRRSE